MNETDKSISENGKRSNDGIAASVAKKPSTFPLRGFTVAAVLTLLLFGVVGVNIYRNYLHVTKLVQDDFRIQELAGKVTYFDEVLTMSARMAANTGDAQWEKRYHKIEPQLDATVVELIQLAPETFETDAAEKVSVLNDKLLKMELRAFELIASNQSEEASKLLSNEEYESYKVQYMANMQEIYDSLKQHVAEAEQILTRRLKQTILLCIASILILLVTWPKVLVQFRRHLRLREESELALRKALLLKKQDDWFKTGLAELNEVMRGEEQLASLSNNIITQLANYLDAQIGAIYLVEDSNVLKLSASYAYHKRQQKTQEFAFGEGMVGQAALEGKTIVAAEAPADYIVVQSGLGKSRPSSIAVVPFVFEDKTNGVIVLGSFQEFSPEQINFLEKVAEGIAIAINSAKSRKQVVALLKETQAQSEELQTQQEALRASNEELEEQTATLQKSEASLQRQQEEMETINAELEEKTESLEKQKVEFIKT